MRPCRHVSGVARALAVTGAAALLPLALGAADAGAGHFAAIREAHVEPASSAHVDSSSSADGACNASTDAALGGAAAPLPPAPEEEEARVGRPRAAEGRAAAAAAKRRRGASKALKGWWEEPVAFKSPNLFHINTQNFNKTISENKQVLVAFYDPRSRSIRELQGELDAAADLLARRASAGRPLGILAACDASVNTYLRLMQAKSMDSEWQEKGGTSAFKFGKPRFYPLILKLYSNGTRRVEYDGVVKAEPIAAFMHRHAYPHGGLALGDAAAARRVLREPGPVAFGCGLAPGSAEAKNFHRAALGLHGRLIWVTATASICSEVLSANPPRPRVIWAPGGAGAAAAAGPAGGFVARVARAAAMRDDKYRLGRWLLAQRAEALQEMTPDNAHMFMDEPEPLLIFLADPTDKAAMLRGERLFSLVNPEMRVLGKFQTVWSDCRAFGDQFSAKRGDCPLMVAVNTRKPGEWEKVTLKDLDDYAKGSGDPDSTAEFLLQFVKEVAKPWRRESDEDDEEPEELLRVQLPEVVVGEEERTPREGAHEEEAPPPPASEGRPGPEGQQAPAPPRQEEAAAIEAPPEEERQRPPPPPAAAAAEGRRAAKPTKEKADVRRRAKKQANSSAQRQRFLASLKDWKVDPEGENGPRHHQAYEEYNNLLTSMLLLRRSYRAVYEDHLPFDFSDLERAQRLRKEFRSLGKTPGDIRAKVLDPEGKRALYRAIEGRAAFVEQLEGKDASVVNDDLTRALNTGRGLLRRLFRRLMEHLHEQEAAGNLGIPKPVPLEVDRRAADGLSVREFLDEYARPGKPLIITGLNLTGEQPEWSLDFFRERCNKSAVYRRLNLDRETWGGLESAGRLPLAEFIDTFRVNATRREWYLHDWSIPRECPAALGDPPYKGFTMPKYFAGDYFQRTGFEKHLHTWPSLFIGSSATESAVHIDTAGTNFWLYLLSGRKEWRFFNKREVVNLYKHPTKSNFFVDVFEPDVEAFPLFEYAQMYSITQEVGDLMFIPGGSPHAVRNLEDIHGVSMNYVDASNVWMYLWYQISLHGDWTSVELFTDNVSFPHGLRSEQEPVPFGEWKSTRWWDYSYDIF